MRGMGFWIRRAIVLAACWGALCVAATGWAATARVLIVHSYEQGNVCGEPQSEGVRSALTAGLEPRKAEVHEFYMDTKRTYTSPAAIVLRGELALAEYERLRPEVVVTVDDNAFATVGLALAGRPGVSVIFSGLNSQPEDYDARHEFMETRDRPGGNITGVYEKLHLRRALGVIKEVLPDTRKVVAIVDVSPTGRALAQQLAIEASVGLPLEWETHTVDSFDAYKELVLALNRDETVQALYPVALSLRDGDQTATAPEVLGWTIAHATKPCIPLNHDFCRMGLFGGASVDFQQMGRYAGAMAAAVLQGKPTGDIPILEAPDYTIVFNSARAKMLGIRIPDPMLRAADTVFTEMLLHR